MDAQSLGLINTLLILLIALLQFLLRAGPQSQRVQDLEQRLEEAEKRLENIQSVLKL